MDKKLIDLIDKEIEFAKGTGMPQFVMGLQQAKRIMESHMAKEDESTE